jgi:hypothetical protein
MSDQDLSEEQMKAMAKKLTEPDKSRWPTVEVRKKRTIPSGKHPVSVRPKKKEEE